VRGGREGGGGGGRGGGAYDKNNPRTLSPLPSHFPGLAYVETANLDGETNLKIKQCLEETARCPSDTALAAALRAGGGGGDAGVRVECEPPNSYIYRYDGALVWGGKRLPLTPVQVKRGGRERRRRGGEKSVYALTPPPPSKNH
jgi:hypothetical protein